MHTEPLEIELQVDLSSQPINLMELLSWGANPQHGASSIFLGKVRDHDPQVVGQKVVGIEYSAHPDAANVLRKEVATLAKDVLSESLDGGAARVLVIHRIGRVDVGDPALLVIVSTAHRQPGLDLVPALVERIKATAPIWKQQILEDGSSQWSNLP